MFVKPLSSALAIAGLALLGVAQIASADAGDGGCCGKKGCTSVPDVKKVAVRCYSDTCEDLCVPKCSLSQFCHGLFRDWHCKDYCAGGHCDGGGGDAGCGECPKSKCKKMHCPQKTLIVKIRVHEEAVRKCVPTCCPDGAACTVPPPPPGPRPEAIPAPKGAPGADEAARQPLHFEPATNVAQ